MLLTLKQSLCVYVWVCFPDCKVVRWRDKENAAPQTAQRLVWTRIVSWGSKVEAVQCVFDSFISHKPPPPLSLAPALSHKKWQNKSSSVSILNWPVSYIPAYNPKIARVLLCFRVSIKYLTSQRFFFYSEYYSTDIWTFIFYLYTLTRPHNKS